MRPEGGLILRLAAMSATRKALQSLPAPALALGSGLASSARLRCRVAYTSLHWSMTCASGRHQALSADRSGLPDISDTDCRMYCRKFPHWP